MMHEVVYYVSILIAYQQYINGNVSYQDSNAMTL